MGFKTWTMFVLLLLVICRVLVNATPPVRPHPQAVPPTMVTGLLGAIYPSFFKASGFWHTQPVEVISDHQPHN